MSDLSLRRRALLRGSAGTLGAGALATTTVSAAAEALSLDVSLVGEVPSGPGEEATLAVTVRNETDRSLRVVLDYHDAASSCCHVQGDCSRMLPPPPIPTENVVDHSDAGAAYDPVSWEWDSLPAGSERRVTVTFTLPSELPAGAEDLSFGAAAPSLCDVEGLDPFASASVPIPAAGTSLSAAFSYSPTNPAVGETVTLDARASAPMDAPIEAFDWDVGDDGTVDATGDVATVTFDEGGDHPVSLRVTERITRTVRGRTVTVPLTDDVTKTVTVREPSPLTTTPSTLDFGTTVAGTTRTTSLSVENRADESVRVSEIDTPTGLAVVPDCEVNYWFVEYGCDPTPPFDVGANGETTVTVSFTAPTAGIVSAVEGPATVRTADGGVSVPVTAASIASARTLATFEATAREFATFLGTGRDAGAAAVGDEVVGMYEDVIQFAGNRIGRQYRDALQEAREAGRKLRAAGRDLNVRQFVTEWEASYENPDVSPQPAELQADFASIADDLAACRTRVEAGRLDAAAPLGRQVEADVQAAATALSDAYDAMDSADAERYLGDFVASVQAFAAVVAGT